MYRGVMFNGTEDWCKIWSKATTAFKNGMRNLVNFHKLKNNDFFLEIKMVELNQNKMSKNKIHQMHCKKIYFTSEISE